MFFEFRFALIVSCSQGSHRDRGKEEEEEEAKEVTEAEAGGGEWGECGKLVGHRNE